MTAGCGVLYSRALWCCRLSIAIHCLPSGIADVTDGFWRGPFSTGWTIVWRRASSWAGRLRPDPPFLVSVPSTVLIRIRQFGYALSNAFSYPVYDLIAAGDWRPVSRGSCILRRSYALPPVFSISSAFSLSQFLCLLSLAAFLAPISSISSASSLWSLAVGLGSLFYISDQPL